MQRYFLIYIIFIVLFHICNYFVWKKARGKRQAAAYLRFGRSYFFLFIFLCILPDNSVPSLLKVFCASCLIYGYALEFLIWRYFMKNCRRFRQSLCPDSKIVILEMYSMRTPWKFWRKWVDLIFIFIGDFLMHVPAVVTL